MKRTFFILGLILIILGGIALYSSHKAQAPNAPEVVEPAPVTVDPSWATYSDSVVSFRYPAELTTTYIHLQEAPKVTVSNEAFSCAEENKVNGGKYCMTSTSEGAAGSTYITYNFTMPKDGKTITLSFTLREPQCLNYDNPQQTECTQERQSFDVDDLADRILQTVELN